MLSGTCHSRIPTFTTTTQCAIKNTYQKPKTLRFFFIFFFLVTSFYIVVSSVNHRPQVTQVPHLYLHHFTISIFQFLISLHMNSEISNQNIWKNVRSMLLLLLLLLLFSQNCNFCVSVTSFHSFNYY